MNKENYSVKHSRKRLWVITELYYPENNQTGYYLTKIAEGLTEKFDVKVICGQPNYAARGTIAKKKEIHRNVEIFRVWGTLWNKDVLLFRLINMISLGISIFIKALLNLKKNEQVLVVSAPPGLPYIAGLASKIKRTELSVIIQDKFPETMIAVGKGTENSITVKIFKSLNRWLYGQTKNIIVVGRDMLDLVKAEIKEFKVNVAKIEVIQNWASLEEIEPATRSENKILKKYNLENKFVFLYAGNMGLPQDLESIVICADKLKADKRFHFIFLGAGVKRKWLEKEIEDKKLSNISLLNPMPRTEQKTFLNACDVGIVSLIKKMRGVAMPSRTYNLLAAGKPILAIAEENSEVYKVIKEEKVGWIVPPGEPELLLEKILQIYDERKLLDKMGQLARICAVEKYSLEKALEKYNSVLR